MARRDPRTPTCNVVNCRKAARRLGLCAEHARHVPVTLGIELAGATISAAAEVKRDYYLRAWGIAQAAVDGRQVAA